MLENLISMRPARVEYLVYGMGPGVRGEKVSGDVVVRGYDGLAGCTGKARRPSSKYRDTGVVVTTCQSLYLTSLSINLGVEKSLHIATGVRCYQGRVPQPEV